MATYYVRKTGSNSNNGTSASSAWLTLTHALGSTGASVGGSTVWVGAGVYRETVAASVSGATLTTNYQGPTHTPLSSLGGSVTVSSTSGLVAPPFSTISGQLYNTGQVITSAGNVQFTYTGISGSELTGVVFSTNTTVSSSASISTSASVIVGSPTWIIGDCDGSQTGDAGQVSNTGYTTNDTTSPSNTAQLQIGTQNYLAFALITFIAGGTGGMLSNTAGDGIGMILVDCTFNMLSMPTGNNVLQFTSSTTGLAMNALIDRCIFAGYEGLNVSASLTATGSADYDLLFLIRNSQFYCGSSCMNCTSTGSGAHTPGGFRAYNCFGIGAYGFYVTTVSTTITCEVHNSFFLGINYGLHSSGSNMVTSSYNMLFGFTNNYFFVSGGTGDVSTNAYAILAELGQSYKWAGMVRPFFTPDGNTSPMLGFSAVNTGSAPLVDTLNRPRPSGSGGGVGTSSYWANGPLELHDFAQQSTAIYPVGETSSGYMEGPGDQELWIPCDAIATTITIQVYQGSGYGGNNYVTATLLAGGEIGVANQIQTASSTIGVWQILTFSSFTPTAQGWIKVRITSYDTSGTADVYFGAVT